MVGYTDLALDVRVEEEFESGCRFVLFIHAEVLGNAIASW